MAQKVLCVDDEANVLSSLRRMLRGRFDVRTALSGREGLDAIENDGPFAVVVADMRMPEMDGITFLSGVRDAAPDTVRMMLTGNADLDTAVRAVNEGNIFRFLTKPCPGELLIKAVEAGLEMYRLVNAERELLDKTLKGSVKVLTDVLSLVNPAAFGRAGRVKRYVRHMAERLKLADVWQFEIAAMLSQIGCVTLPAETVGKLSSGRKLSAHEEKMLASHPATGGKLIANIPRLENVAAMIAKQLAPCEREGRRDDVAVGAQMLKVALEFDKRVTGGIPPEAAIAQMRGLSEEFDPEIVSTLKGVEVRHAATRQRASGVGGGSAPIGHSGPADACQPVSSGK